MKEQNSIPKRNFKDYKLRTGFKNIQDWHHNIFDVAKKDSELITCARGGEFHIYFKGGKILEINPQSLNFDTKYLKRKDGTLSPKLSDFLKKKDIKTSDGSISLDVDRIKNDISGFFSAAKSVMKDWFDYNPKQERADQQEIILVGNTPQRDLAVIDIEFAVSFNANYYNQKYMDSHKKGEPYKKYPNPRFDIIAVDGEGQVHVIELKTGLGALDNAEKHVDDFFAMIGNKEHGDDPSLNKERWKSFLEEMAEMISVINKNNLRRDSLPLIDTQKPPLFHFAFTPKENDPKKISREDQLKLFSSKIKNVLKDGVDIINVKEDYTISLLK